MKRRKLYRTVLLVLLLMLSGLFQKEIEAKHKDYVISDISDLIKGIIEWKSMESGSRDILLEGEMLASAGNSIADWYAISIGRLGYEDTSAYLAVLEQSVTDRYRSEGGLDKAKATEWYRISLTVLACGGDPTSFGTDREGNQINLIRDGVYQCLIGDPGSQGLNGYIWALITLDAMQYQVPENALWTREMLLDKILEAQLPDGGFSLDGSVSDTDMTAMALTALAPYIQTDGAYAAARAQLPGEMMQKVSQTIEKALSYLENIQTESGGFSSWGTENAESTAQVAVALCTLGIDPLNDERFVKNGHTLLDGLMQYHMGDGGFLHAFTYEESNPLSGPDESNSMAGEQVLYALTALYRYYGGYRNLYDFRTEKDSGNSMTDAEAGGVNGAVTDVLHSKKEVEVRTLFTKEDKEMVGALPDTGELTTEFRDQITSLLAKLNRAENISEYEELRPQLEEKKAVVDNIQSEINEINQEIAAHLYPFDSIEKEDKELVDELDERIKALSGYDRKKITGYEDVLRIKSEFDWQSRTVFLSIGIGTVILILLVTVAVRMKKQKEIRRTQQSEQEEEDEDW